MSEVPVLTLEERRDALEKAKAARKNRSLIKAALHSGEMTLPDVITLAETSPSAAKMRVLELLESMPGYGSIRARNLMEKIGISNARRIGGLGRHQRDQLLKEFDIPSLNSPGALLVLSGPGGVGKSTVAKALRSHSQFWVSVSATTRSPRDGEVDGVDYFFYSQEEFDNAISTNQFLEWAEFAGNRYGTPKDPVASVLATGKNVLLEIEIEGAKQIKSSMPEALLVFLEPPSWEELVARLEGRGSDSPERRAIRLALAQEELAAASFFDTVIVNTEVNEVVSRLLELATAHRPA